MELIREAVSKGRQTLNEIESKEVLKAYGIPVAREVVASDRDGLSRAMETIGFPLVIKPHDRNHGINHLFGGWR